MIVPCFNEPPAILRRALASVGAQTFADFECLIVDESTNPESIAECEALCAADPRLRRLRPSTRLGLAASLNLALDAARGDFIARFDADDICAPQRLALQLAFLRAHPNVGVLGGALQIIDDHDRPTALRRYPLGHAAIRRRMCFTSAIAHPTVMIRRDVFDRHGGYDPVFRFCEDLDLWLRLIDAGVEFANLPDILVRYRQVSTHRAPANWRFNLRARRRALRGLEFPLRLAGLITIATWSVIPAELRRSLYRRVNFDP